MERIEIDPDRMCGKPVIRGTRLTVEHVIGLLARGETIDSILAEYANLSREDILACLAFAEEALNQTAVFHLRHRVG